MCRRSLLVIGEHVTFDRKWETIMMTTNKPRRKMLPSNSLKTSNISTPRDMRTTHTSTVLQLAPGCLFLQINLCVSLSWALAYVFSSSLLSRALRHSFSANSHHVGGLSAASALRGKGHEIIVSATRLRLRADIRSSYCS